MLKSETFSAAFKSGAWLQLCDVLCSGSSMTWIRHKDQQLFVSSMLQDSEKQDAFQTLFSYFEGLAFITGELVLFLLKLSDYQKNVLLLKCT